MGWIKLPTVTSEELNGLKQGSVEQELKESGLATKLREEADLILGGRVCKSSVLKETTFDIKTDGTLKKGYLLTSEDFPTLSWKPEEIIIDIRDGNYVIEVKTEGSEGSCHGICLALNRMNDLRIENIVPGIPHKATEEKQFELNENRLRYAAFVLGRINQALNQKKILS